MEVDFSSSLHMRSLLHEKSPVSGSLNEACTWTELGSLPQELSSGLLTAEQ